MGFDYSYSVLPISHFANFRQACIRCFANQKKGMFSQDGFTQGDVNDLFKNNQIFYWLAPRPWKTDMLCFQHYGGTCSHKYISKKEHVIANIKKTEPEWVEGGMEEEFIEDEFSQKNNIYKKMIQVMNACPQECVVVIDTDW